jgi:hypothetical protein
LCHALAPPFGQRLLDTDFYLPSYRITRIESGEGAANAPTCTQPPYAAENPPIRRKIEQNFTKK